MEDSEPDSLDTFNPRRDVVVPPECNMHKNAWASYGTADNATLPLHPAPQVGQATPCNLTPCGRESLECYRKKRRLVKRGIGAQ